jgi:hypothetical protein
MAKQIGLIKLSGTLDGVTMHKSKFGNIAKTKSSLDGSALKNSESFKNTRKNNAEFGRASLSSKLFVNSVLNFIASYRSLRTTLTKLFLQIIKNDAVNAWGKRMVLFDNLDSLLYSYPNKGRVWFFGLFPVRPICSYLVGNISRLLIPLGFVPNKFYKPQYATHFDMVYSVRVYDFDDLQVLFSNDNLILDKESLSSTNDFNGVFDTNILAPVDAVVFSFLTIKYYQELNGAYYLVNSYPAVTEILLISKVL